uniref:Uncharacterized protein n=1 Tax=Anguilla anguilla TaxID=7936 RepID=A0A0E9QJJ3_ANGAN
MALVCIIFNVVLSSVLFVEYIFLDLRI